MSNVFNFVGTLRPVKDSESFKGFTVKNFDSGWMTERLVFNVITGTDVQRVEINAGRFKDENKNVIYSFSKPENGKKGEPFQIPWSKRHDEAMIEKSVGWKIFTVDTDNYSNRKKLEESGDEEALAASNKKRKHFLAGTDFCEYVNKVVNSDKVKDMKFRVTGNINYVYSAKNDQYYSTYEVTKIYRVEDDREPENNVVMDFYYTEGAMDATDYDETGKAIVSGYTKFYDNNTKKNWYLPMNLAVRFGTDDAGKKKVKGWEKFFNKVESDEVRRVLFDCKNINGSSRVEVTYNDLSDETKEYVDMGMITLEQALRDAGGSKMGERIQEIRLDSFARGFSTKGSEDTTLTVEDLIKKPIQEDVVEDIFEDEDI